MKLTQTTGIVLAVIFFLLFSAVYTVDEREKAILFKFKEIVDDDLKPGLHFKIPTSIIHSVKKFPAQILTLEVDKERFLTGEKKYVLVDFFVKWRVSDVATYYRSTLGDHNNANSLLDTIMKDGLKNEFRKRTIQEAISGERGQIMTVMQEKSNIASKELGIEIVDVRVSRIDFPDTVSNSVFDRMRSERQRVAQDFRSRGEEEAEKIKAAADREATVIRANAYREAEKLRGEGDAKAAAIYAEAYSKDPEFYSFYRSLTAYKEALGKSGDVMVLEPNSEFFNYFKKKGN
jgi:membrane protease subunit HflC